MKNTTLNKNPQTDEDVKKIFCTEEAGIGGIATFGIYQIFRNQEPEKSVKEIFLKTLNHVIEIVNKK